MYTNLHVDKQTYKQSNIIANNNLLDRMIARELGCTYISLGSKYEMSSAKSILMDMWIERHCDLGGIRTESCHADAAGEKERLELTNEKRPGYSKASFRKYSFSDRHIRSKEI